MPQLDGTSFRSFGVRPVRPDWLSAQSLNEGEVEGENDAHDESCDCWVQLFDDLMLAEQVQ